MSKIESIINVKAEIKKDNLADLSKKLYDYLSNKNHASDKEGINFSEIKENALAGLYDEFGISNQQIKIIMLLKNGFERKEICDKLGVSLNTLKTHLKIIFKKCNVNNKAELLNIFW